MKKLPLGIQSFEKVRLNDCLYVDKTDLMFDMAQNNKAVFFLSRPRRFGKSLLISTLKAYFKGKRELFEGLKVMDLEKEWHPYTVLHLDLNTGDYTSEKGIWDMFRSNIMNWERDNGITSSEDISIPNRIEQIIRNNAPVVFLVDEYDKPLLETVDQPELQARFRTILKSVYSVLKTCDQYIRFAFITGVSKFSQVSIFSDLNNLNDISLEERFSTLCGITEQELHDCFQEHAAAMAKAQDMTVDEVFAKTKAMYDGYHFACDLRDVYNPYSLLYAFTNLKFNDFWFQLGTPTFLTKMLKEQEVNIEELVEGRMEAVDIMNSNKLDDNLAGLLYQTGYVTIKSYDKLTGLYRLGFPNGEVTQGFISSLFPIYLDKSDIKRSSFLSRSYETLFNGKPEEFLQLMQSFMADIPYELVRPSENYYQTVIYIICRFLGFRVKAEYHTSRGRIDMLLQHGGYTYIFEFKIDGSADGAIAQINDRDYPLPFAADGTKLYKIGVNFNTGKRNIDEWRIINENNEKK